MSQRESPAKPAPREAIARRRFVRCAVCGEELSRGQLALRDRLCIACLRPWRRRDRTPPPR